MITAHPTETRRRTIFDTQHRITQLMRLRLNGHELTDDGRDIERELRRNILTLWQTALIRLSRLKIQDEIETGLRYYPRRSSRWSRRSTPKCVMRCGRVGPIAIC